MTISIIIRTKDEEKNIGQVLRSIYAQEIRHKLEVIVVDSGSTDKTLDIAKQYAAKILNIPGSKFSYGYSLNYGILYSSGDIICSLSAHCIPKDNSWLSELVKPILERKADATYGRQIPDEGVNPLEELFLKKHFPEYEKREARVSFSNANCAFAKKMWDEIKFDEHIPSWEDYLWYLLAKDRFVFQYAPKACVIHTHSFSVERLRRTAYRDGRAFRYMKDKYKFDILQNASSVIGKLRYAVKDIASHTIFLLRKAHLSYLFILPFVKIYSYLNYWKGYHSDSVIGTGTERGRLFGETNSKNSKIGHKCTISFIIPNWNHRQLLHECISSIYSTVGDLSHEIIVVDNASTDDSAGHIRETFPEVIWLQNDANLGYAKAINLGVAVSKGDFLFLLNNDVRLTGNTSERLKSFLDRHPDAGAVAPMLYYPDGRMQISCRRFPTLSALLLEALNIESIGSFHKWKLTIGEHLNSGMVLQPRASALMVERRCWELVGPMDEGFPIFFNDVDWCYRLYKYTDYKIYLYPEARAVHHEGASVKRLGYRKKIELYKGLLRFYRKHFPFCQSRQITSNVLTYLGK